MSNLSLIENIKSVTSVIQQMDNIELYQKILDVYKEAMDLQEQNRDLKEQIYQLKDKLSLTERLKHNDDAYWTVGEDIDGPYCTCCWDAKKMLVRFVRSSASLVVCPNCGNKIKRPSFSNNSTSSKEESYVDEFNRHANE